jgi:uncharacterized protein (TIGR02246 family)
MTNRATNPRQTFSRFASPLSAFAVLALVAGAIAVSLAAPSGYSRAPEARSPALDTPAPNAAAAGIDLASARSGIDTGNTNLIDAVIAGNSDLFAACFAQDGAMILPNGGVVTGRDSIRAVARRLLTHLHVTTGKRRTVNVRLIDDRAYETGQWAIDAGPAGASPATQAGSYVNIWKNEGGSWKLWRGIAAPPGV